jgi:hypothetical protein
VSGGALSSALEDARRRVRAVEEQLGRRLRILVGKPGLDGVEPFTPKDYELTAMLAEVAELAGGRLQPN